MAAFSETLDKHYLDSRDEQLDEKQKRSPFWPAKFNGPSYVCIRVPIDRRTANRE